MKTCLITGASKGLGAEMAKLFAKDFKRLILVARSTKELINLKKEILDIYDIEITIVSFDLSSCENYSKLYNRFPDIDLLVNNAGFGYFGESIKQDFTDYKALIDLNILALTSLTNIYGKKMSKIGKGEIINISSTASYFPVPLMAVYAASKAYVESFSLAIQKELKEKGVNLYLFSPGEIKTEFQKRAKRPKSGKLRGKIPTAKEIADEFYKAYKEGREHYIPGKYNRFLVFLSRLLPKKFMVKKIYEMNQKLKK